MVAMSREEFTRDIAIALAVMVPPDAVWTHRSGVCFA
jgi:hypothetical protein